MHCLSAIDAARLHVEQHLVVDLAAGRGVAGALYVVGVDHQARDRVVAGFFAQVQRVLFEPRNRAPAALLDLDHAVKHGIAAVLHHGLEVHMAFGVGAGVPQPGCSHQVLRFFAQRRRYPLDIRASAFQTGFGLDVLHLPAQADSYPLQAGVIAHAGALCANVVEVCAPALHRHKAQARAIADKQLGGRVA